MSDRLVNMLMAPEIEKATLGYVNSGVLRQWVVKGYIQAGPKAKRAGGPRTFSYREAVKASLIAELRQTGVHLGTAALGAGLIIQTVDEWIKRQQIGESEDPASGIYFVLINRQCDQVIPLTLRDTCRRLVDVAPTFDSFRVLRYADIVERLQEELVK